MNEQQQLCDLNDNTCYHLSQRSNWSYYSSTYRLWLHHIAAEGHAHCFATRIMLHEHLQLCKLRLSMYFEMKS